MPHAKPAVIYGGPYAHETDEITLESSKEKPNYDKLISGWKTISQGAMDYIATLKRPEDIRVGPFTENVVIDYDKRDDRIPDVADFDRDRKALELGDLLEDAPVNSTVPENAADEDTKTDGFQEQSENHQTEVDLDNL